MGVGGFFRYPGHFNFFFGGRGFFGRLRLRRFRRFRRFLCSGILCLRCSVDFGKELRLVRRKRFQRFVARVTEQPVPHGKRQRAEVQPLRAGEPTRARGDACTFGGFLRIAALSARADAARGLGRAHVASGA